jgi:chromosome partitioning protein
MKVFAILNMKGGVGKTTTAINLAYVLAAEYQFRVLLADADAQANATRLLLPGDEYDGMAALLRGRTSCYDELICVSDIPCLDVLPASDELWSIDLSCVTGDGSRAFGALLELREAIEEDDEYDIMIIDCPPNFSAACVSAIKASDCIVIPVLPDAFSSAGMASLVQQIDGVRKQNPQVRIGGCLINQWHNADVVTEAEGYLREKSIIPVYRTVIRRTDKVPESTWARQPVLVWSPQSAAARDYRAWVQELIEKGELRCGEETV